jgi:hypothetical protein
MDSAGARLMIIMMFWFFGFLVLHDEAYRSEVDEFTTLGIYIYVHFQCNNERSNDTIHVTFCKKTQSVK